MSTFNVCDASPVNSTCAYYWHCGGQLQPNADIAGLGVITAFLISSWVVAAFLLVTYWGGLLPPDLLRPLDRWLFFASSRHCDNDWKRTLEEAILVFSDQQLITGIGILIAGFIQLRQDLSVYHWNILRSLAYLSSTVHLMTISLLRDKLEANKHMKNLRLLGMSLLLGLLAVAMVPTTIYAFVPAIGREIPFDSNARSRDKLDRRGTPAHCFWGHGQALASDARDQSINFDSVIAYVALFGTYVWKLSQLFDISRGKLHRWLRVFPDVFLERAARRALNNSIKVKYKFVKFCYIIFMVYAEIIESFMLTILVLFFTLSWGTLTLLIPRFMAPAEVLEAERDMQFGQLLPLLLLLQPLLTIYEHFVGKRPRSSYSQVATFGNISLARLAPSGTKNDHTISTDNYRYSANLTDAFRNTTPLSVDDKTTGASYDTIQEILSRSRVFRFLVGSMLLWIALEAVFTIVMLNLPSVDPTLRLMAIGLFVVIIVVGFPIWTLICLPFSRKLR